MLRLTLGLVCVVCSSVRAGEALEWESKKGHKTQATFEGLEVVLKKENGEEIRVSFHALSVASQEQALRLIKEAEVPQVEQEPKAAKPSNILSPARVQKVLGEIKEIKRQAKLQGSTAKNDVFFKEEMSKLDKKHGKFKVKFAFPVKDVVQRDGSYKLLLSESKGPLWGYLGMDNQGVMSTNRRGNNNVLPDVTKQEMMEIGQGTHQYEVVCEMSAADLSSIVDGRPSPPVKQADCKLVKIRGR